LSDTIPALDNQTDGQKWCNNIALRICYMSKRDKQSTSTGIMQSKSHICHVQN